MTFAFVERDYDPLTLSSVVGQAVGAGSVCWENMSGTGVFQSNYACEIVDAVIAWIEEHYVAKDDVIAILKEAFKAPMPFEIDDGTGTVPAGPYERQLGDSWESTPEGRAYMVEVSKGDGDTYGIETPRSEYEGTL